MGNYIFCLQMNKKNLSTEQGCIIKNSTKAMIPIQDSKDTVNKRANPQYHTQKQVIKWANKEYADTKRTGLKDIPKATENYRSWVWEL